MNARRISKEIRAKLGLSGWVDVEYIAAELGFPIYERAFLGSRVK